MTLLTNFAAIKERAIKAVIPPEQNTLSADELEIKNEAQKIANIEADFFDAFLQAKHDELNAIAAKNTQLNQELDKTGLISTSMNKEDVLATVGSHVQKDLENREPAIDARVKLMEADTIWRRFRAEHNLTHREAKYPKDLVVHSVPILTVTAIEALAYTTFYRKDGGLLDGLFVALIIAAANLVACGGLGYFSRYKNLVKPIWQRNFGFLLLVISVIFAIWFNGTLTFYRDNYTFSQAAIASLSLFTFNWSLFKDIEPFAMWILGIGCSMLAWHTGYTLDDKYPHYSDTDKAKKEHQISYDQEISKVTPDKTIQKLVQELDDIIRQANNLHRISTIKEEINNKSEAYKNLETKTNEQLKAAITYFREHQLAVRAAGMSAPNYFNKTLPTLMFRPISTDSLMKKVDDIDAKNQALDARINQYVTPTLKLINANKPQIATEAKREFIQQVDKTAQERLFPQS